MAGEVKHYFARGNTAAGAYNLFESAFQDVRRLLMLTGGPGTGKSTIISNMASYITEAGYDVQLFHDPSDHECLDGLIVDEVSLGIVDGLACRLGLAELPGVSVKVYDLGRAVDAKMMDLQKQQILELERRANKLYSQAYESFGLAKRIHDEWEALYIDSMDFAEANEVADELIESLFGGLPQAAAKAEARDAPIKKGKTRHLFLGAATPIGPVDFVPELTRNMNRTIFIKGRPGSGKSTLLKKLVSEAANVGIDVEVFHCGLDPSSLDMVIFPELKIAVFDSTKPHEYFPTRSSDEILDMYERAMKPGTDEMHEQALSEIKARYETAIKQATAYLLEARHLCDEIKNKYASVTDFDEVQRLQEQLRVELLQ